MAADHIDNWSDKRCIEIAYRNHFQSSVKNINVQKSIVSRFLNFYLSGHIPKGQSVTDIVFAVLSIMPFYSPDQILKEELIWAPSHYSDEGTLFFLSPDHKLQYDISMIKKKNEVLINEKIDSVDKSNSDSEGNIKINDKENKKSEKLNENCEEINDNVLLLNDGNKNLQQDISSNEEQSEQDESTDTKTSERSADTDGEIYWFRKKHSTISSSQASTEFGPVENAAFCISCNKLLDNWNNMESRVYLKYFFGVVALVLMRTRVKSFHNIHNYFNNKFHSLHYMTHIRYSPPNQSCIKKCWKAFKKLAPNAQTVYAKLVVNSFFIDKVNRDTEYRKNIFKMTVLAHAANYGMGLISMLQEIACSINNIHLVLDILQTEETKEVMNKVRCYIKMYLSNKNEITHHWSRVIEIEQFSYLCCKNNPILAVIMAAFIEKLRNNYSDIWKSTWVKDIKELDSLKNRGYTIYEKYSKYYD